MTKVDLEEVGSWPEADSDEGRCCPKVDSEVWGGGCSKVDSEVAERWSKADSDEVGG